MTMPNSTQQTSSKDQAVFAGIAVSVIGLPFVSAALVALGIASWHGDGLGAVLVTDSVFGVIVGVGFYKSTRFAKILPFIIVGLLAVLVIQVVVATVR